MNDIRKDYDQEGNWIGITQTMEMTKSQASAFQERMELQTYRTVLGRIRDLIGSLPQSTGGAEEISVNEHPGALRYTVIGEFVYRDTAYFAKAGSRKRGAELCALLNRGEALLDSLRKIHGIAARELSEPPDGGAGALVLICTEAERHL